MASRLGGLRIVTCVTGLGVLGEQAEQAELRVLAILEELGRLVQHSDPTLALHLGRRGQVQLAHVSWALRPCRAVRHPVQEGVGGASEERRHLGGQQAEDGGRAPPPRPEVMLLRSPASRCRSRGGGAHEQREAVERGHALLRPLCLLRHEGRERRLHQHLDDGVEPDGASRHSAPAGPSLGGVPDQLIAREHEEVRALGLRRHAPQLRRAASASSARRAACSGACSGACSDAAPQREEQPRRLQQRGRGGLGHQELEAATGSAEEALYTLQDGEGLLRGEAAVRGPQPTTAEGTAPGEAGGGGLCIERAVHGLVAELVGGRGVEEF
mmetsp:Transcript_18816/g.44709  ORF Transcript_18816/g.44709 Transcript_18816/m.44709 type:complete len:327 (+) Transcript_18816:422-1402(+)